jgi:serine O-acetyltransferase
MCADHGVSLNQNRQGAKVTKFSADVARYKASGDRGKELWLNPAVWAIGCYRLRNWVNVARPPWPVSIPLKLALYVANKFCEIFLVMCISPMATIGEGLYIGHVGGVHISQYVVIGKNCDISHRVTIGASAMGRQGVPTIGDNVYIGTGSTLIGKIKVGNGVRIAANTLIIDDVPDGATMMGVPGRILLGPPRIMQSSPVESTEDIAR